MTAERATTVFPLRNPLYLSQRDSKNIFCDTFYYNIGDFAACFFAWTVKNGYLCIVFFMVLDFKVNEKGSS